MPLFFFNCAAVIAGCPFETVCNDVEAGATEEEEEEDVDDSDLGTMAVTEYTSLG